MAISASTCDSRLDVAFLLDSSGSLNRDYGIAKDFLKLSAATFGVSENGTRSGVILFSKKAELSIKLNSYYDTAAFYEAVNQIRYMQSQTFIDKALRLAQTQLFTKENGARDGVTKFIVLFTDGTQTKSSTYEPPNQVADELR